uniref:Uncharacterized protein n=1 Tax=Romanomermis culicivorax TaxID=13658 RepID=A0A915K6C2_ROMCU
MEDPLTICNKFFIDFNVPGKLACYYIKHFGHIPSSFVLFVCHGNGGDLGLEWPHLAYTSWRLSCDVFMFDYTGFGQSCPGHKSSADQILDDVGAAYHFLTNDLDFDKVPKIVCPVLIIHGGDDEITDIQNVRHFLELCKTAVPPLIIPGGGHLALGVYRAYWNRIEYFISTELRLGPTMYVYRCGLGCPKIIHSEEDTNSIHETYIGLKAPDLTKLI